MLKFLKYANPFIIIILLVLLLLKYRDNDEQFNFVYHSSKLSKVIESIDSYYVDSVDAQKLEKEAIYEILKNLDPHSTYLPPKETKSSNEEITGKFFGIGIRFNIISDTIMVVNTISGGPSAKVGINAGDRIVTCDDSTIAGVKITNERAMSLLKGDKGTVVRLGIKRNGASKLIPFEITRDRIKVQSIPAAYLIKDGVGYIKINNFSLSTHKEFVTAVAKLRNQGMVKLMLDLRGNGGGVLSAAAQIANEFLPANKLIVYTEGIHQPRSEMKAYPGGVCLNMPVSILVDSWSASASEILAGALQDNDMGTIIGRRTFGKGLVQKPIPLGDGSELRLTIAKYYTPTGRCIQKPYGDNKTDYYSDIYKRFENGEFSSRDSIKVNDSLKFTTPKGKVVYGGGGIIPDVFMPLDTLGNSKYLRSLRNSSAIYRFVLNYVDNNRKKLEQYTNIDEILAYIKKDGIMKKFIQYAAKEYKVKYDKRGFATSKNILIKNINALIAQNVFDENAFYYIVNQDDNIVNKALEILQ